MSERREAWSPPSDWRGDIEIEVRASGGSQTLTLMDATRDDWHRVNAALAEAAQRHAYAKAARERAKRARHSTKRTVKPSGTLEAEDEPQPGHTGPGTGHA
jgi:hypothetical protein